MAVFYSSGIRLVAFPVFVSSTLRREQKNLPLPGHRGEEQCLYYRLLELAAGLDHVLRVHQVHQVF